MKEITVTRPSLPPMDEYINEIKSIWETRCLTNTGDKHIRLQAELAKYLDAENAELLSSGHAALELTMEALGLEGEVITTPFTFASTANAIVRRGLTPVFCDIKPDNFTIDPSKIEELITEKTSAILPVHVYGNICDTDEIERIAEKHGLRVIYDAAHAFGVKYKGKGVGSFGDVSCFSFHATKVFNTVEGGAVTFRDSAFGEKIRKLKNFGLCGGEDTDTAGCNAKMNEFSAAMGLCNLRHIDEEIKKRKAAAEGYLAALEGVKGIKLPECTADTEHNYIYFPALFDETKFGAGRDEVFKALKENGIYARKYFYPLTSNLKCFKGKYRGKTPTAEYVSERILSLPMYSSLSQEDIDRVCAVILKCKK